MGTRPNLTIMGGNVGTEEIKLDDLFFLSGIDGKRLNVKVGWGGTNYKTEEKANSARRVPVRHIRPHWPARRAQSGRISSILVDRIFCRQV